jgi:hypothetical protein
MSSTYDLVVDPYIDKTPISVEQGQTSTVTCSKKIVQNITNTYLQEQSTMNET